MPSRCPGRASSLTRTCGGASRVTFAATSRRARAANRAPHSTACSSRLKGRRAMSDRGLRGEAAAGAAEWFAKLREKAGDGTTDFIVEIRQSDLARLLDPCVQAGRHVCGSEE